MQSRFNPWKQISTIIMIKKIHLTQVQANLGSYFEHRSLSGKIPSVSTLTWIPQVKCGPGDTVVLYIVIPRSISPTHNEAAKWQHPFSLISIQITLLWITWLGFHWPLNEPITLKIWLAHTVEHRYNAFTYFFSRQGEEWVCCYTSAVIRSSLGYVVTCPRACYVQ